MPLSLLPGPFCPGLDEEAMASAIPILSSASTSPASLHPLQEALQSMFHFTQVPQLKPSYCLASVGTGH